MRKLVRVNLESLGMVVREAVSVEHGLTLLGQAQVDLVVLDLDLPDGEGLASLEMLDSWTGARVPIVFLSAEPPSRTHSGHRFPFGYVQKPFSVPVLLQHIQRALSQAETGGSLPGGAS
jgi:DNA-binding response OmpR family regulator